MHRVLAIHPTGTPDFPRYIIADDQGEVWNGQSWSSDPNDAVLYAGPRHVLVDCANLQRTETLTKPCLLQATIPVKIEAFSDEPLDPEVLKAWLYQVLDLHINVGNGSGPTAGSIVLGSLAFGEWADTVHNVHCKPKEKR